MYWAVNNVLSVFQTKLLKLDGVKAFFGIPKPPVPVPGAVAPQAPLGFNYKEMQAKIAEVTNLLFTIDFVLCCL